MSKEFQTTRKDAQCSQDSFMITFAGFNRLQKTASFFNPPFRKSSQINSNQYKQKVIEANELRNIFGAKPRSPAGNKQELRSPDLLKLNKKNSVVSLKNQSQSPSIQEDTDTYFVQPVKSAEVKRRPIIPELKKQFTNLTIRKQKLPTVYRDTSSRKLFQQKDVTVIPVKPDTVFNMNGSNSLLNVRDKDFMMKSRSFHQNAHKDLIGRSNENSQDQSLNNFKGFNIHKSKIGRSNDNSPEQSQNNFNGYNVSGLYKSKIGRSNENSPDQSQNNFKGFKLSGIQNKMMFRQTQFAKQDDQAVSKGFENSNSQRNIDFGIKFDESQYWSNPVTQKEPLNRQLNETKNILKILNLQKCQIQQQQMKQAPQESQPSSRSFLQRKQQMAILTKLFQKNQS